jgi:hypothetical protein
VDRPINCRTSILQTGFDKRGLDEVCERPKTTRFGVGLHTLKPLDQIISASSPLGGLRVQRHGSSLPFKEDARPFLECRRAMAPRHPSYAGCGTGLCGHLRPHPNMSMPCYISRTNQSAAIPRAILPAPAVVTVERGAG